MYFDALGCRGVPWGVVGCHGVISSTGINLHEFLFASLDKAAFRNGVNSFWK